MDEFYVYSHDDFKPRLDWCIENFGPMQRSNKWEAITMDFKDIIIWYEFRIYDEEAAMAFKLRWI